MVMDTGCRAAFDCGEVIGCALEVSHRTLGLRYLQFEGDAKPLFTENDTNVSRLYGTPAKGQKFKDAFHEYLIGGKLRHAVKALPSGTKAAVHYELEIHAKSSETIRLRLRAAKHKDAFSRFESAFNHRRDEADEFYASIQKDVLSDDARRVQPRRSPA